VRPRRQNFAVQPPPPSPRRLRQHPSRIPPPRKNKLPFEPVQAPAPGLPGQQTCLPEPSIINEKTIADFTRVVEQTGILEREARRA